MNANNSSAARTRFKATALAIAALLAGTLSAPALAQSTVDTNASSPKAATSNDEKKVEIKVLDDKNFDSTMKDSKLPVLVDFTAVWCKPCQRLKPKLEELAQEFKGKVTFAKVEITKSPNLAAREGVNSYPTVTIYAPGGKVLSMSIGDRPIEDLRAWIESELKKLDESGDQGNGGPGPDRGGVKR